MCFTPFLCLTRHCCTRGASRPFRLTYTLHGRHRAVKRVYVIDSTIKTDFFLTFLSFFHSFNSFPKPSVLCLLCMHVSSPPHSLFRSKRAGCSSEANTLHRGGRGEWRTLYYNPSECFSSSKRHSFSLCASRYVCAISCKHPPLSLSIPPAHRNTLCETLL